MSVVMDKGNQECWYGAIDQKSRAIKSVEWCFKEETKWCWVMT